MENCSGDALGEGVVLPWSGEAASLGVVRNGVVLGGGGVVLGRRVVLGRGVVVIQGGCAHG